MQLKGRKLMSKPVAPCKDCKNRHLSCHSACDTYQAYAKDAKEYTENIRAAKADHYAYDNWHRKEYEKWAKNKGVL